MSVCHLAISPPPDQGLHALYKACVKPLEIFINTEKLILESEDARTAVNEVDHKSDTPLSLLVLHVNRGLRYHPYKIEEIQNLEDNYAPQHVLDAKCQQVDEEYQNQVLQCISLLLSHGANPNHISGTCPGVVDDPEWAEGFETKIMQSERRWNLLGLGASMKYSKYNTFDPLTNCKVMNDEKLTILHYAAWRGDVQCLELLINSGSDVTAQTTDGRNVLHFLYHYCNCPSQLQQATQLLIQSGADVNATDGRGNTPLMLLLYHVFMKRSHVRYMATKLLPEYTSCQQDQSTDNFHKEILASLVSLLEAGASVNHINKDSDTPLHVLYRRFKRALENCDEDFQVKGHHIVPYLFSVEPLVTFAEFLLKNGASVTAVDVYGNTALHKLCQSIKGLSLANELNSAEQLLSSFSLLLERGVNVNGQGSLMKTAVHMLLEIILKGSSTGSAFTRYKPVLDLLVCHGADVNKPDQLGNTAVAMLFGKSISLKDTHQLLLFLLRCGGNPSIHNRDGKYPLQLLLRLHVLHHDPSHQGQVTTDLTHFLNVMSALSQTMTLSTITSVVSQYQEAGFYGVICESACPVYQQLMCSVYQPRSLAHSCRLVIWKSMGTSFHINYQHLPLPKDIKTYLFDLVT